MANQQLAHCVSSMCATRASRAFAYLADAERVGEWALGCWGARRQDDLVAGTSLFDGTVTFARPVPSVETLTVDFEVGGSAERLERRITARVVPGEELGMDAARSLVILLAWRTKAMDDERWRRLMVAHEAEILILQARLEERAAA